MRSSKTSKIGGKSLAACVGLGLGSVMIAGSPATANQIAEISEQDIETLREQIREQQRLINEQRQQLDEQSRRLNRLEQELGSRTASPEELREHRGAGVAGSGAGTPSDDATDSEATSSSSQAPERRRSQTAQDGEEEPERVGEPPEEEQRPDVAAIAEQGGILTPRGTLIVEPSIEYAHTSTNRFVFQGFELAEVVLIGAIEASDANRDAFTSALTLRYGITDRFEVDVKVPWVIRNDRVTNTIVNVAMPAALTTEASANYLGDVEFAGHYQLNQSRGRWPYFIANLRVKTPTGRGPFDVDRNAQGVETELSTGSGFWAIEPSITLIYPSEPAVFFASIGYVWNIGSDVDEMIGGSQFGHVDPGDAVRGAVGMGLSINDRSSFSIGYKHDFIMKTDFEIDGVTLQSESLQSGSIFIGFSHRVNERWAVNLTIEGGVTDDAPDARILLRVPIRIDLLSSS